MAAEASNGGALFEIACGKGGDLPRWESFHRVVGVDVNMDNITNAVDGAYRRLADQRTGRRSEKGAATVFVCMDAAVSMRPPFDEIKVVAKSSPHGELIAALWDTSADRSLTTTALTPYRGIAAQGFDVVSCQFAVHYFFANATRLERLATNVAWLCKPGGVFIGTCFDGTRLASRLERGSGEVLEGKVGAAVAWRIAKAYDGHFAGGFGAAIDVFLDTINQTVTEYLVNFDTLESAMSSSGMEKVWTRPFDSFYEDYRSSARVAMTAPEKELSSYYTAFMFRRRCP